MTIHGLIAAILAAMQVQSSGWVVVAAVDPKPLMRYDFEGRESPLVRSQEPSLIVCRLAMNGIGWAGGSQGTLLRTADAGLSWTPVSVDDDVNIEDVSSADGGLVWVIGSRTRSPDVPVFLKSTDAGLSWIHIEILRKNEHGWLAGIHFQDARHGWVVGKVRVAQGREQARIWESRDGGATWNPRYSGGSEVRNLTQIRFTGSKLGWAVGENAILKTVNGGKTWTHQRTPGEIVHAFSGVSIISDRELWVFGDVLLHSIDGGISWVEQNIPRASGLRPYLALCFSDGTHAWASVRISRKESRVFVSSDGGRTWDEDPGAGSEVYAFSVADKVVLGVRGDGRIVRKQL